MGLLEILFIFGVISLHVKAEQDSELAEKYLGTLIKCFNESGLTEEDLAVMQQTNLLDSEKKKCMYACAYKSVGMMDEHGMLNVEKLKEIAKETYSDDPEKMEQTMQFIQHCKSVNDEPVSDGEKGCERAALMFKCSLDKAPELSLK